MKCLSVFSALPSLPFEGKRGLTFPSIVLPMLRQLAFLSLVAIGGVASAQTFDFKGIVLGGKSSAASLQREHALACQSGPRNIVTCRGKTTLLGQDASLVVYLTEDIVQNIVVTYKHQMLFDDLAKAYSQKFGKPKSRALGKVLWRNAQFHEFDLRHGSISIRHGKAPPKLDRKDL
jgi:hypothetical protein